MSIASHNASCLVVLGVLTIAAPGWAQTPVASTPNLSPLAPGDAIRTTFWREPQMNGEYKVDETGSVLLPLLGARNVQGVVPAQLKAQLASDYGRELRSPEDVQIVLLHRVRVLGAVKQPGLYLADPTMTVGDVVAVAGGVTPNGKLNGIRIMRDGRDIRTNLDAQTRVGEQLSSGDQILVPERSWFSRQGVFLLAGSVSALAVLVTHFVK